MSPENPPCSDPRALRRRLRGGDHDAFADLFRAEVSAVHALAYRLTGSRATAEDVTSETFMVAWRRRQDLELDERPLRPWVLGIAARQSLNAARGARRRGAFLVARARPDAVADFADETVGRLDDAVRLGRAQEALARLSRHEAEVVGLCAWSGLSYAEAADALGVPVGTVRSRLSRARARLRRLVEEPPGSPDSSDIVSPIPAGPAEHATRGSR